MAENISRGQGWLIIALLAAIGYGLYYGATQAEAALSGPAGILNSVGSVITGIFGTTSTAAPSTQPTGQPAASTVPGATPII